MSLNLSGSPWDIEWYVLALTVAGDTILGDRLSPLHIYISVHHQDTNKTKKLHHFILGSSIPSRFTNLKIVPCSDDLVGEPPTYFCSVIVQKCINAFAAWFQKWELY